MRLPRWMVVAAALLSGACAREKQVWLAPNLGSPDLVAMFSEPDRWPRARARVDVFKFYSQHVLPPAAYPCPGCEGNTLDALRVAGAFTRLSGWGIETAVEAGAVKPWGCTADVTAAVALDAVRGVASSGGTVRYLAMDEPLLSAGECGYDLLQAARVVADFEERMKAGSPGLQVGDIEPYPRLSVAELLGWTLALRREGLALAFFHVDVDRREAVRRGVDVAADLQALREGMRLQGVPFGVILWGEDGLDDAAYAADVLAWSRTVEGAVDRPLHVVFQSWSRSADGRYRVPRNLPEEQAASHTRLLLEGLETLEAGP